MKGTRAMQSDWFIARVVKGIQIDGLSNRDLVYVRVLPTGKVHVIGAGKVTAIITLDAAKRCLRTERDSQGRQIPAGNPAWCSVFWDSHRGARPFDMRCGRFDFAA